MSHGEWPRADKALPSWLQSQPFDRTTHRIGPVKYPHRLSIFCCRFENVPECRDEGIDAAAYILEINEQHIERVHHGCRGASHFTIEAKDWNPMLRVVEVWRL